MLRVSQGSDHEQRNSTDQRAERNDQREREVRIVVPIKVAKSFTTILELSLYPKHVSVWHLLVYALTTPMNGSAEISSDNAKIPPHWALTRAAEMFSCIPYTIERGLEGLEGSPHGKLAR